MKMGSAVEAEDFEDIIEAAEALLSESESYGEPEEPSEGVETARSTEKAEPRIESAADAQAAIRQRLQDEYGGEAEVNITKANLEQDESDGRELWVVEGDVEVRKRLFWRKKQHFTYFLDAVEGKIRIVSSSRR
jgi:hypothetical protein